MRNLIRLLAFGGLLVLSGCGGGSYGQPPNSVDAQLSDLKPGYVTFTTPDSIVEGQSVDLDAVLSKSLLPDLQAGLAAKGVVVNQRTIDHIGNSMKVDLTPDDGFTVNPIGTNGDNGWQSVTDSESTTWSWKVKAISSGKHVLTLSVTVALGTQDAPKPPRQAVVGKFPIDVQVDRAKQVSSAGIELWKWASGILAAVIGGLIVFLVQRRVGRPPVGQRRDNGPSAAAPTAAAAPTSGPGSERTKP